MWSRNAPKKLQMCPSVYYLPQMWKSWTHQSSVYKGKSHFTLNQVSSMSRIKCPEIQVPRCPVCFICPEVQIQMYSFKCPNVQYVQHQFYIQQLSTPSAGLPGGKCGSPQFCYPQFILKFQPPNILDYRIDYESHSTVYNFVFFHSSNFCLFRCFLRCQLYPINQPFQFTYSRFLVSAKNMLSND